MNTLEPVIAFIDERTIQLKSRLWAGTPDPVTLAKMDELQMIRNRCTALIEQDKLLQNALAR